MNKELSNERIPDGGRPATEEELQRIQAMHDEGKPLVKFVPNGDDTFTVIQWEYDNAAKPFIEWRGFRLALVGSTDSGNRYENAQIPRNVLEAGDERIKQWLHDDAETPTK